MRSPDYYAKLEAMKALAEMEESQDADAKASRQKMTSISREVQLLGNEARKRTKASTGPEKAAWEKAADALMRAEAACDAARAALFDLG